MTRRSALLVAALGIAALGTLLIIMWVRGIEDRATEDQELVEVLVATETIEAGELLDDARSEGKIETKKINRIAVVDNVLTQTETVEGKVALETIHPGEQILEQNWGEPGQQESLGIDEGEMAISVELSDPDRVAGFVTPGSEVAIFCTALEAKALLPGGESRELGDYSKLIVAPAKVLGIGNTAVASRTTTTDEGEQTTEEVPRTVLTISVTQNEAEQIILCRHSAIPTFALLTDDSQTSVREPGSSPGDLFPQLFRGVR